MLGFFRNVKWSGSTRSWAWCTLAVAAFVACNGDLVPEESDEPKVEDPWMVGGMGGVPPVYDEDGDPPGELRLRFERVPLSQSGGGTDMVFLPNEPRILMTLRGGSLLYANFEDGETSVIAVWDFDEELITDGACGPTNILLDPDFEENSFIYVSYCVDDAVTRLVRYTWSKALGPTQPAVIFETVLEEPLDYWHRFGSMGFEEGGVMWFFLGEHFHPDFAQDFQGPHGALHRIIPNREPGGMGYTPAPGNMTAGMGGAGSDLTPFPSLYAYGLRSPWRATRDSLGRYWVGDVGHGAYEEVNIIDSPGQNFGWPIHEGPCEGDCGEFVDPVAYYSRSEADAYFTEDPLTVAATRRAIWVGEIYQNPSVDRYADLMDDVVIFGDLFTGWVRALRADEDGTIIMDKAVGHLENVTQWRVAPDGYAYALDLSGQLHVALLDREE